MNIQDWFPLGLTGLISLQSKGLSRIFSNTTVQKNQFFGTQLSLWSSSHIHLHDSWKNHSFDYTDLVGKVMSLLFNTLSRLVIAFLPRSKHLFNFMAAVTICSDSGAQENKVCHCCLFSPIYLLWSDRTGCHDLSFWMLNFKPAFSLSSFIFIKRLFSSSLLSAIRVVSSVYLRLLIFLPAVLIQLVLYPAWHFARYTPHVS